MNMWKLGWLCLALPLFACPQEPLGECGGYTCAAGQRCESSTKLCVTDELPVITVVTPTSAVNTPTFVLTGTITDDISVKAAYWRAGDTGEWKPIERDGDAKFTITVDAPLLDAQNVTINFRASDANSEATKAVPVLVDRVGPVLRLIRPDGLLVGTATVEIAVDATDGSGSLFDLSIAGVAVASPQSGIEAVGTIPVPATLNGEPLRFEVTSADLRGNRTTQTFSVIADRVAPVLSFISPLADQYVITPTFQVELQVLDPSPIASVSFQLAGGTYAATQAAGIWMAELPFALEEADQLITAEATDAAGNVATAQVSVHVDRIVPTVTVNTPIAASLHRTGIPVSVTTSLGTDSVTASLEGQQVTLTGGPTSWSGTLPIPQRDYSAAMVQVTARDLAGNGRVVDVAVMVDAVAPVIAFSSPASNQKFNATHFATTSSVTSSWTVTDADTQTATTVNGVASSALTLAVPTSVNDDPTVYTTTVTATDRAGNVATATRSYSVDRKAPTIASWTPDALARNVDPLQSVVTFSEPVSGPLPTSPALALRSFPAPIGDVWDLNHTRFTLPLGFFQGRVVEVELVPGLADDFGNPFVPVAFRKFHLVRVIASGTLLRANVSAFAVSSDRDGEITLAMLQGAQNMLEIRQSAGSDFTVYSSTDVGTRLAVNSWRTVNPATLESVKQFGVSVFNSAAPVGAQYRHLELAPTGLFALPATTAGVVVSRPPLPREPTTTLTGSVIGTTYTRGALTRTLPTPGNMLLAQSDDSWAVVSLSGNSVRWSRYRCNQDAQIFPGPATYTCDGTEYATTYGSAPDTVFAAMTPSGNCLSIGIKSGPNQGGFLQRLDNCDGALGVSPPASCNPNTSFPGSGGGFGSARVAPFSGNGEDSLLSARAVPSAGPNEYRLEKTVSGFCTSNAAWSAQFNLPNVREFAAVQIGNKPAFVYLNTSNELRVHIP